MEKASLTMLDTEQLAMHIHTTLEVFADGEQVTVPADIGIDRSGPTPATARCTPTTRPAPSTWSRPSGATSPSASSSPSGERRARTPGSGRRWPGSTARLWAGDADDIVFRDGETITLRYTSR
ncbi:hypothetical protein ACFQVA_08375 [Actinomadura keratinilytica]